MKPIRIETSNVVSALKRISAERKIALTKLDFNIISHRTYINLNENLEVIDEYEIYDGERIAYNVLSSSDLKIRQVYLIDIFEKNEELITIPFKLSTNKTFTKIFVGFNSEKITYFDGFEELFQQELKKRLLKVGALLDIFDSERKELNEFLTKLKVRTEVETANESFLVCDALEPIFQIDDKLIKHYFSKVKKERENGTTDHRQRGFLISVDKNELVIEYRKPKPGKSGRDCRGKFLYVREPSEHYMLKHKLEHIFLKETEDSIKYFSEISGYLSITTEQISIKNEMEIKELNFKKTGSITSQETADISLNVTDTNVLNDAIGSGTTVVVKDLNVKGSVGPAANLKADTIVISGSVHRTARIECNIAQVNRLKGYIRGSSIKIDTLEGGKIEGDIVHIKNAYGGTIIANEIYIDTINAPLKIIISRKLETKKMLSDENLIVVDPKISFGSEVLKQKKERIKTADLEVDKLEKAKTTLEETISKNKSSIMSLKNAITKRKESRLHIPEGLKTAYKRYETIYSELKHIRYELTVKRQVLNLLTDEMFKISEAVTKSKILTHGDWKNYNKITFRLPNYKTIDYIPKNGDNLITIIKTDSGDFEVKVEKNDSSNDDIVI